MTTPAEESCMQVLRAILNNGATIEEAKCAAGVAISALDEKRKNTTVIRRMLDVVRDPHEPDGFSVDFADGFENGYTVEVSIRVPTPEPEMSLHKAAQQAWEALDDCFEPSVPSGPIPSEAPAAVIKARRILSTALALARKEAE